LEKSKVPQVWQANKSGRPAVPAEAPEVISLVQKQSGGGEEEEEEDEAEEPESAPTVPEAGGIPVTWSV
jgi:hypothetical protein